MLKITGLLLALVALILVGKAGQSESEESSDLLISTSIILVFASLGFYFSGFIRNEPLPFTEEQPQMLEARSAQQDTKGEK